jgi:hypothetical protein
MSKTIQRMWINQPSSIQSMHTLHGIRVLACPDTDETMRVYFLSGETVSMQVPRLALSKGWPRHRTATH